MNIVICIIWCFVLITVGYLEAIAYLNNVNWKSYNLTIAKVKGKNRVLYLLIAVGVSGTLIYLFRTIYVDVTLLVQLKLLTLVLFMFPIAIVDYRFQKIPNCFILWALIIRGLFYIIEAIESPPKMLATVLDNVIGVLIIGGFFLLILLLFKNSIGMGDIKLFAIMALYQGLWGAVNAVFCSLVVSFFWSIFLLITRKKKRKDMISFGPSILIGTIIAIGISGM